MLLKTIGMLLLLSVIPTSADSETKKENSFTQACLAEQSGDVRIVCANIGAHDQTLVYNRFGSFNPFGMIFSLDRNLSPLRGENDGERQDISPAKLLTAMDCDEHTGAGFGHANLNLEAGNVRLQDCKRPRPMVLRVNVGDVLLVQVTNYLFTPDSPDFSSDYCKSEKTQDANFEAPMSAVSRGNDTTKAHGEALCSELGTPDELHEHVSFPEAPDWPNTRLVNFVVQGLRPLSLEGQDKPHDACLGINAVGPDNQFLCKYEVLQEGTYFFASHAAPSGGEGNGGSIVHGLFGAIVAEREGTRWYRSQTSSAAFDTVWPQDENGQRHARNGLIDYEKTQQNAGEDNPTPLLNMARVLDRETQDDFALANAVEIVHTDLNAIILCDPGLPSADCHRSSDASNSATNEPAFGAFREFSVFFHDETKTKYTRNFEELDQFGQLAGVKDGFAINYGASGMGSILLANRKGIGPSSECMECLYEEFFLTSWANGDPALLEWYSDDPSNVHHSYLNDPVVFRNFHAGPKETHVFHLHAHQWFAGNDPSRGAYLDSQTVAPQQGFTYNIYHGGLRGLNGEGEGWWDVQGSGNRNRTLGDSIFHCHLYPHFAQGMWALWRVHDVLEDGTRKLPDGQPNAKLSTEFPSEDESKHSRLGSVDRLTGLWLGPESGTSDDSYGTPIPALIPLPGETLPLLPTYAEPSDLLDASAEVRELKADAKTPMPGFPFYIAGKPGHRPPQAPLDIARDMGEHDEGTIEDVVSGNITARIDLRTNSDAWLDGGLGRHVVGDGSTRKLGAPVHGDAADKLDNFELLNREQKTNLSRQIVAKAFALGDLSGSLKETNVERLPNEGTRIERAAMGFHYNGTLFDAGTDTPALKLLDATGRDPATVQAAPWNGSLPSRTAPMPGDDVIELANGTFYVNGNPPKPGAPFADPCGSASSDIRDAQRTNQRLGIDPFTVTSGNSEDYFADPFLLGFRRYEVSAVQVDLVVNRAGWHDPQARINVLTEESGRFKDDATTDRISPTISDTEEPFFFRAMSGECIEFRHTNELPKELQLDDFQVKTPTDTVGQHIHLVKFDVTSSDGSANGWNYEDGTFAPDEIALRICTAKDQSQFTEEQKKICDTDVFKDNEIWRLTRADNRHLFQTTVQRWFADPILALNGDSEEPQLRDRTLRTVFTHDHFAPSSIQQHGFYSALVIEPGMELPQGTLDEILVDGVVPLSPNLASICKPDGRDCVGPIPDSDELDTPPRRLTSVAWGHETWDGSQRRIAMRKPDPAHPDFREFALSVADFALLYDPRDRTSEDELLSSTELGDDQVAGPDDVPLVDSFGMSQLFCEAKWRLSPFILGSLCGVAVERELLENFNGTSWHTPDEWVPAWIAGGLNRDEQHKGHYFGDTFETGSPHPDAPNSSEVEALFDHIVHYRQRAAGYTEEQPTKERTLAKPVAPPARPESISVDHHDPYLVNYRGAPLPLRVGDKEAAQDGHTNDCRLRNMGKPGLHDANPSEVVSALIDASFDECSVGRQLSGAHGDMGELLVSSRHGDAETPVLEAYADERLAIRLVQGAQEVQHTFNVAGLAFKRNIDQHYPGGAQPLDLADRFETSPNTHQFCMEQARAMRPDDYAAWRDTPPPPGGQEPFWDKFETLIAECDNLEGFTFAQEIGISEHFEMNGSLRSDVISSVETVSDEVDTNSNTSSGIPTDSSDFMYDFGSVDALWNGAWGLVRIFKDDKSLDPATVEAFNANNPHFNVETQNVAIGSRLGLPIAKPQIEGASGLSANIKGTAGIACPRTVEGEQPQKVLRAFIIALETRSIWNKGTDYGVGRYDPDGLMLAFLSPEQLGVDFHNKAALEQLNRNTVLKIVGQHYNKPVPLTLRVNAGDCVELRYINALESQSDDRDLLDQAGDATLPPITPLNVARDASVPGHGERVATLGAPVDPNNPGGLKPSATLALNLALPGMDLANDLPLAYGYQGTGLAPASGAGVTVSNPLLFYAGRMRINLNFDPESGNVVEFFDPVATLAGAVARRAFESLKSEAEPWLSFSGTDILDTVSDSSLFQFSALGAGASSDGVIKVLGAPYELTLFDLSAPDRTIVFNGSDMAGSQLESADCWEVDTCSTATERLSSALADALSIELDKRTHWIPYAFGPAPLRSTGDIISHVQHGLFGAIDIVPRGWVARPGYGQVEDDCNISDSGYKVCGIGYSNENEAGDGHPMVFDAAPLSIEGAPAGEVTREFILYYQDGLNLHDPASRIQWQNEDGSLIKVNELPLKLVPDCAVCDDSYDRGEKGVSYRSIPHSVLSKTPDIRTEISDDLNAFKLEPDFINHPEAFRLEACEGERLVVRVVHPGGRARQRAFIVNGINYDDLFPGFGFPRSALVAPGKTITAWLWPNAEKGTYLWHDGPTHIRAGGVWGLIEVSGKDECT